MFFYALDNFYLLWLSQIVEYVIYNVIIIVQNVFKKRLTYKSV